MRKLALVFGLVCACRKQPLDPNGAVLVKTGSCATRVATSGEHVYYLTLSGLERAPKNGGRSETLASIASPVELAIGDEVYVAGKGGIAAYPKKGGAARALAPIQGLVQGLVTDGARVYFVDFVSSTSHVWSVPTSGGKAEELQSVAGLVSGLAVDDRDLWFVAQHELVRMPKSGGARAAIGVTVQGDVLAAIGAYVFVSDGSSFVRVDKATHQTDALARFQKVGAPRAFVDRDVLWLDDAPPTVNEVAVEGGAARVLMTTATRPTAIAADDASVYWSVCPVDGGATIWKRAR